MIRVSEVLLNFLANAGWQIPLILIVAGLGAHLLKSAPARYRHALWLAALGFSLVAPALSVVRFSPGAPTSELFKAQALQTDLDKNTKTEALANEVPDSGIEHLFMRRRQPLSVDRQWLFILSGAYFLLISFQVVRLVRKWRRKEKLRGETCGSSNRLLEQVVRRCRRQFDLSHVRVCCSNVANVPATWGVREPLIVLPASLCAEWDEAALLSVVGHEMAHVARRDFLVNLICEVVCVPISFHPFTYFIKREIQRTRELACDELVAKKILAPEAYARSLVKIANATFQIREQSLILSVFDGNILEERVLKLTQARRQLGRHAGRALMTGSILTLGLVGLSSSMVGLNLRAHSKITFFSPLAGERLPITDSQPKSDTRINRQTTRKAGTDSPKSEELAPSPIDSPNAQEQQSALDSSDAQALARSACAAGQKGDREAIPGLISMLADDRQIEPIRCAYSRWSPALHTLKHPSPGEQAAIALASMGGPALAPLTSQLNAVNSTARRNAAWAIGELTNMLPGVRAGVVPQLISLLKDSDSWVQMAAARALGELSDARAAEPLIAALTDSDPRVRQMAAWALSELKDRRAVQELCRLLLSDGHADVRRHAAEALGEINSPDALPSLKQALNDPEASVRAKAGWAIGEIEGDGWAQIGRALSRIKPTAK